MKGTFNHIEFRTSKAAETFPFYKDLLTHLEWEVVAEWPGAMGLSDGSVSLWFFETIEEHQQAGFNRDAAGVAHFGIHLASRADVEAFTAEYLEPHGIAPILGTPQARDDFGPTYFQVMFEDPEGLLIEVFTS